MKTAAALAFAVAFGLAALADGAPAAATQASPSAAPAGTGAPAPAATPAILMLPPDAPPQILWIQMSSTTPQSGDVVSAIVLTSSNVASVELRVGGYGFPLSKTDIGRFEGSYQVPQVPFFMSHSFVMLVIARNTAGVGAQTELGMQIR